MTDPKNMQYQKRKALLFFYFYAFCQPPQRKEKKIYLSKLELHSKGFEALEDLEAVKGQNLGSQSF